MGDPGLVADDLVDVALARRAGAQTGEVGAIVRLGEDGGGQDFAGRDLGQIFLLLLLRAADEDQFAGDLRARAERADADVGARQLLGDDAHGDLAHAGAAIFLGNGEAEHAHLGKAGDDLERDVVVLQMPFMGMGRHIVGGEFVHLAADGLQRLVEAGGADRLGGAIMVDQLGEAGAVGRCVAGRDEAVDLRNAAGGDVGGRQAEIREADELALAHRNAAEDLRQIFGEGDAGEEILDLAIGALGREAIGIGEQLAQALHIGREPGEAVGGVLLHLDQLIGELAVLGDAGADGGERLPIERLHGGESRLRLGQPGRGGGLGRSAHSLSLFLGRARPGRGGRIFSKCRQSREDATVPGVGGANGAGFSRSPGACASLETTEKANFAPIGSGAERDHCGAPHVS